MEFEGKNLEEAIKNAAEALSLPAETLKFTIISMGSAGFLGLGRKKAKIAVNSSDQAAAGDDMATAEADAESVWNDSSQKGKGGEGLDFMRDQAPPQRAPREKGKERRLKDANRAPQREREEEAAPLDFSHLPPPLTLAAPGEALYEGEPDEAMRLARETVESILAKMGFTLEVTAIRIANRVVVKIAESGDNALLIGSRGGTLEALELLTSRTVGKKLKESAHPDAAELKVVVDVADYRARRQSAVLDSLRTAAATVRRTKKSQTLSGLNSSERRLVQAALRPHRDISSRNDAPRDCVIISMYQAKDKRK